MTFKWRDNSVRILALFIAVILWVYVTNEQNPVTDISYNITLEANQPEGYIIKGLPRTVNVRFKGVRSVTGTLQRMDFSARVDLSGISEVGEQQFPVQITSPPGVEVLQVTPQTVRLQVDRIVTKSVPVVVSLKGNVADGQQAGEPVLKPPVVSIRGPSQVLDEINQLGVTVNVNGAKDTLERVASVETGAEGVSVTPDRVAVTIPVIHVPSKTIPVRIRLTGEPAPGYTVSEVTSNPLSVQVTANDGILNSMTAVSTMAVDITGVASDVEKEAVLLLPDGVKQLNPESVHIIVKISPVEDEQQPPPENETPPESDTQPETQGRSQAGR
ncbi:YbbR domain-containing protein [Desulfotomaculum arcticum]|uniref:YbbR domain-containing protein n=1 Tax=Desulfotruncus arcticus DSM 17038 TaxID=1121424 RepID=A0A1I2WTE2_9FIRM|nr:CdaR family protein [Desulfotruncus arcticus]SFH04610.1 YbbR domain-containing protein [Desulfotomaculum arcticum] [Desulfotruncus arcticus DSM 17038]